MQIKDIHCTYHYAVVHIHIHVHVCAHVHVYTVSTCKLQELHNELCVAYHWIDGQSIVCIEELFIVQILLHIKHVNSQAVHVHENSEGLSSATDPKPKGLPYTCQLSWNLQDYPGICRHALESRE